MLVNVCARFSVLLLCIPKQGDVKSFLFLKCIKLEFFSLYGVVSNDNPEFFFVGNL